MNERGKTGLTPQHFEQLYEESSCPWDFTTPYETTKFDRTLQMLPRRRYERGLDVGCSTGVLTERLAERCDSLLAIDVAEAPLESARERCGHLEHVSFQRARVPEDYPDGVYDLIVLSEVGYYLTLDELERTLTLSFGRLVPGGQLLLVHWQPWDAGCPIDGAQVHQHCASLCGEKRWGMRRIGTRRHEKYWIDLYERARG